MDLSFSERLVFGKKETLKGKKERAEEEGVRGRSKEKKDKN